MAVSDKSSGFCDQSRSKISLAGCANKSVSSGVVGVVDGTKNLVDHVIRETDARSWISGMRYGRQYQDI